MKNFRIDWMEVLTCFVALLFLIVLLFVVIELPHQIGRIIYQTEVVDE